VVIGLTGEPGSQMRMTCHICLRVPSKLTERIKDNAHYDWPCGCELLEHELTET
jgi:hypothetical protein